jgi:hypothetical protein
MRLHRCVVRRRIRSEARRLPGQQVIVLRERYEGKIGGWLAATGQ